MSTQIQRRRGTTAEHSTFTGVEGELTVDTTKDTAVVHDGTTVGGHPLQKQYPPLGSAAAPTYTFTGDTNTGIYSPGADQVAISTGGSGRLFVDASGKISIGHTATTGTNTQLEVAGGSATELKVSAQSASNANFRGIRFGITGDPNDYSGIRFQQNSGELRTEAGFAGWGGFQTFYTNGTERLRITSAGLVGIGTSAPGAPTHIIGTGGSTTSINVGLIVDYEATGAEQVGAGTAILFRGKSGGGGLSNYNQAQIATNTTGNNNAHGLSFYTKPSAAVNLVEGFRLTNTGQVGIGVTAPQHSLSLLQGNALGWVSGAGNAKQKIEATGSDGFDFYTGSTPTLKATLDSSGRLLVGTSTATNNLRLQQSLGVVAAGSNVYPGAAITAYSGTNTTASPVIDLNRSRGTTNGSMTTVASGDYLGFISFTGADGTGFIQAANIAAVVDGTPGGSDMPGRLVFSTTADGASSPTERMRITSDAYVRLASGTGGIQFNGDTAAANALDDYEEGTFSPTLSASGATFGYSFSTGRYTKIGNSVTVHGRIILSSASGGSGTVTLTGLPFAGAPAIGGNNIGQQGIIGRSGGFAGDVPDSLEIKEGVTEASIYYRASANAATSLLDYSDLGSTAYFLFTLTYRTTN
jgi:hypothetical protein